MNHKVGILGLGYVGQAIKENFKPYFDKIFCYDKFFEEKSNVKNLEVLVNKSDIIFLCLPTPMETSGKCHTDIVECEVNKINNFCNNKPKKTVVIKSTIPPGTTDSLQASNDKINLLFNPEFLTEKNFIEDFKNQKNIIIGGNDKNGILEEVYRYVFPKVEITKCKSVEAEMIKYFINTFLATKVSFVNEMKILCDRLNIDYDKVSDLAKFDDRIGSSHLKVPGPDGKVGFGGSCFPKDINALIFFAKQNSVDMSLLKAAWEINLSLRKEKDWEKLIGRSIIEKK